MAGVIDRTNVGILDPIIMGMAVTPSDAVNLPWTTRQLRVTGASGDIVVTWANGEITTEPVLLGETLDWSVIKIGATGTTATGIRAYR